MLLSNYEPYTIHTSMQIQKKVLANWGNYPKAEVLLAQAPDEASLRTYVAEQSRIIARGAGKCYGDAALGPNVADMQAFNRLIEFDAQAGRVICEAGVLLADLLPVIVPAGWFFHVTPGIKHITVGGAIASDVHGKNHPSKGCFSNWLDWFDLILANGEVVRCSRTERADLFWQSCGGMGWTGIILRAQFQLMPIRSAQMRQYSLKTATLADSFNAFENNTHWTYAAGWIDCLAKGRAFGRGAVFFAEHETQAGPLVFEPPASREIKWYAPSWFLNPLSIRMHNAMFRLRAHSGEHASDLDRYFYPLDRVKNWNRLYGRRGFIQYQFCLPEAQAFAGIEAVLRRIQKSADTPFLSVLKRHGERPAEALNSFPMKGYSLALDFPRTRSILSLVPHLDDLVWSYGGKIYLTKDACSAPQMGRIDPATLGEAKFWSYLKGRIQHETT